MLGAGGSYKTEASIVKACRSLGHQILRINVPGWSRALGALAPGVVLSRVKRFAPDRIVLTKRALRLGRPAVERLSARYPTAFWHFDAAFEPPALEFAQACRSIYVTSTRHLELSTRAGSPPVRFLPQGVDPDESRIRGAIPAEYRCDVSFIGSGQYASRHQALRLVAQVARLQIRGPEWEAVPDELPVAGGEVRGARFVAVVLGSAISLGLAAEPALRTTRATTSNRIWKVLGAGGFYLAEYAPGLEHFAGDGEHCVWFRSHAELLERVGYYLADPEARNRIAAAGRTHALSHHTYAHRLDLLLSDREYPVP